MTRLRGGIMTALIETLVHDPRVLWPDTLSLAANGFLYFTVNQIERQASFHEGYELRKKPYALFRVKMDGIANFELREWDLTTVREATYQVLRDAGMNVIFGNPGSTELPFLRDMPEDFRYVLALHERSAAGIGIGYAMGTRNAAFVNLHSVASVGNGLSSLVDAMGGHVPLVVTTGQQDRRHVLAEPFLVSRAVETVRPYVKWAYEPLRAEDVPAAIARGYYLAMQPPMGPVFISIPMDDWTHECAPVAVRRVTHSVSADPAALDDVVRALDACRNPALVVGAQIEEDGDWDDVIRLAEHLDADVFQQPIPPRWTFPRRHRLFRGGLLPAQRLWRSSWVLMMRWSCWGRRFFFITLLCRVRRSSAGLGFFRLRIRRSMRLGLWLGLALLGMLRGRRNIFLRRCVGVSGMRRRWLWSGRRLRWGIL